MEKVLVCGCGEKLIEVNNQKDSEFNASPLLKSIKAIWRTYKCPRELNTYWLIRPFVIHTTTHILGKRRGEGE